MSLVSLSADNGNPTAITACNPAGNTYEALTAPQTVAAGKPFIRVELGSGTFYFRPQNNVVLEAGSRYTYNVRVNATGLTLEGSTIGDWADGGGEEGTAEEDLGYIPTTDDQGNVTGYTVYASKGLLAWNEAVQKNMSLNCTLIADIDMPKVDKGKSNWTPVGYLDKGNGQFIRYTGTFEGGGHTITGLTVYLPNQACVGLIGCLGNGGTVQNLTLAEVEINGDYYVGGVAGYNYDIVTACYWNNSLETGLGYDEDSADVTKVDGSTETWETAQNGMNEAIDAWNDSNLDNPCNWHYAETDAETPPALEPIND